MRAPPETHEVLFTLAAGANAEVLLVVRPGPHGLRKLLALKQLRRALALDAGARAAFAREGARMAILRHPNLPRAYDAGEREGLPFFTMEYLEGQRLQEVVAAVHALALDVPPWVWLRVLADVLAALQYLHERVDEQGRPAGLVHRAVSLHDVFLTYEGRVVLLDLHAAAAVGEAARMGAAVGGSAYQAPEQLAGGPVHPRADVFSVGVMAWELLAGGRRPRAGFADPSWPAALPRLTEVNPAIDEALDAFVAKALAVDPAERFQGAAEMRQALDAYVEKHGGALRRDALGGLLSTCFDEERRRIAERVRARAEEVLNGPPSPQRAPRFQGATAPLAVGREPVCEVELVVGEEEEEGEEVSIEEITELEVSDILPPSALLMDTAPLPSAPASSVEEVLSRVRGVSIVVGALPADDEEPETEREPETIRLVV